MEDSSDVDINPTKIKKAKRNSVTERKSFEKKRDVESEKIMQNGTGWWQLIYFLCSLISTEAC